MLERSLGVRGRSLGSLGHSLGVLRRSLGVLGRSLGVLGRNLGVLRLNLGVMGLNLDALELLKTCKNLEIEKTIENISKIIDESKTVLWNGPPGYFELKDFSLGSNKIAKKITENTKNKSLTSVAGGGDTVAAINKFGCSDGFTYISTAGGALLELLEGKNLPGIKALEIND